MEKYIKSLTETEFKAILQNAYESGENSHRINDTIDKRIDGGIKSCPARPSFENYYNSMVASLPSTQTQEVEDRLHKILIKHSTDTGEGILIPFDNLYQFLNEASIQISISETKDEDGKCLHESFDRNGFCNNCGENNNYIDRY